MQTQKKNKWLSTLPLFIAALIWGSSFIVVKDVVDIFPPMLLMAIRFLSAFFILSVICYKRFAFLDKKHFLSGALLGVLIAAAYLLQTFGIMDTTPGKNAFLTTAYCVMVPFFFWMIDKKRPDTYSVIGAVICLVGIGFISLGGDMSIRMGDVLTLCSGVFFALHIVAVAKMVAKMDVMLLTILQFGIAGVICLLGGVIFEVMPTEIPLKSIGGLAYLIIMPTLVGSLLQNIGQKHANPVAASIILSLESVFGVVFSVLFYGEAVTLKVGIGFVLVFIAVIVSETKLSFLRKKKGAVEPYHE